MIFVLQTISLFLLRAAYKLDTQDIEIVSLPVPLRFKALDQSVELILRRNDKIVASQFQIWKNINRKTVELPELRKPASCHYLHRNDLNSAIVSFCKERGMHGLIIFENITLEITPVQSNEISITDDTYIKQNSEACGELRVVKRTHVASTFIENEWRHNKRDELTKLNPLKELFKEFKEKRVNSILILELAVFFDESGYNLFLLLLNGNDEELRDMLLAYINAIQAIYHHSSLVILLDISVVRLEIIQQQSRNLLHFIGKRKNVLNSFCNYCC